MPAPVPSETVVADDDPITLVYEPADEETVQSRLLALLGPQRTRLAPDLSDAPPAIDDGSIVVSYLSDEGLARLVGRAIDGAWTLGILPHPELVLARRAFGVAESLDDAVRDILGAEQRQQVDVLTCNGTPVFEAVVIGELSPLTEAPAADGLGARLRRLLGRIRAARSARLRRFILTTEADKRLETAALAVIAVEDLRRSVFARGLIEATHACDGMLHALVLGPRTLTELGGVWLCSLWKRDELRTRPPFIGHIGSASLSVSTSNPVAFTLDGSASSASQLVLRVIPCALALLPGRHLKRADRVQDAKEVFRVQGLPIGEACDALAERPVPWRRHAATEEFRELFQLLRESARPSATFLTLMILSSLLATIGLFAASGPVIIGAMILAPLMAPTISLAMGVLRQDPGLVTQSLKTVGVGSLLAFGSAALFTTMTPLYTVNAEIAARLHPTLLDLGVAVLSGIAGAYAHARVEIARSLAGVAIAVALVPPLAVSGIGLGWWSWPVFSGASLLFLTNLTGIVFSAALTFLVLGFSPFRRARQGLLFSLIVAALISIPLGRAFEIMVSEHQVIRTLDGWSVEGVALRDVRVQVAEPLQVKATLLSSEPITAAKLRAVKAAIEQRLGEPVVLEAVVAVIVGGASAGR